jgi:hypothetical protein
MSGDVRYFNNIVDASRHQFFFLQGKTLNETDAIPKETLGGT